MGKVIIEGPYGSLEFLDHYIISTKSMGYIYRLQTKFAKVMFLQVSVCPQGEACMVAGGGREGACVVGRGACMVGRG